MVSAEYLLECLPPIKGRKDILIEEQTTDDIISEVLNASIYFQPDYNQIPQGTFVSLKQLWIFTKKTFTYKEDSEHAQDLKSPSVMLHDAIYNDGTIDCKCYSLFIAGCLQALGWNDWEFKFASYNDSKEPTHVYVICEGWILDCCMETFNTESNANYYICINPYKNNDMAINRISGNTQAHKRLNHNPTIYGRQRKYGTIGEGNNHGGIPKPNKQGKDKPLTPKEQKETGINVPLPAPNISIISQPLTHGGIGSFIVKPDITFAASLAYPIYFSYYKVGDKGQQKKDVSLGDPINLLNGKTFTDISEGRYECFFGLAVRITKLKPSLKSNVTTFVIKSPETKIPTPPQPNPPNPNKKDKVQVNSNIFTPTNLAIGAGVIIGGYLLTRKK